jgi:hypothetical protein
MGNNDNREFCYCFLSELFQTSPQSPRYAPAQPLQLSLMFVDLSGGGGGDFCELIFRMY